MTAANGNEADIENPHFPAGAHVYHHYSFIPLLFCLILLSPAKQAIATDSYTQGIEYFQQGDFDKARQAFEIARKPGTTDAQLEYNLGSSYYRLQRYDEARIAFLRAATASTITALAHYNLGLVAIRQERLDDAKGWFRQAIQESDGLRIQQLSRTALMRLTDTSSAGDNTSGSSPWSGLASIDLGYDDNVTLQPDTLILSTTRKDDFFFDIYGLASRQLSGNEAQGLSIEASLFGQKYTRLSRFDSLSLALAAVIDHPYGKSFRGRSRLGSELTLLDGRGFTTTTRFSTQAKRKMGKRGTLRLQYALAYISSLDKQYDYLSGWRQRLEIRPRWHWPGRYLMLGYRYEYNNRADRTSPRFTSFSATRHRFQVTGAISLPAQAEFRISAYYRESLYHDPSTLSSNAQLTRDEDRLRISLLLSKQFSQGRELSLSYQHTRNDSNTASYDYENNQYMASLLIPW